MAFHSHSLLFGSDLQRGGDDARRHVLLRDLLELPHYGFARLLLGRARPRVKPSRLHDGHSHAKPDVDGHSYGQPYIDDGYSATHTYCDIAYT
jgi:hypothetical protein